MNSKEWRNKALSLCLIVATIATYSTVTLAGTEKVAGELLVTGKNINGVLVNGETAQSGRTIFSSSTIATSANTSAIVNIGKIGNIELSPNTNLVLSFSGSGINGELLSGSVKVLSSENLVNIKLIGGELVNLKTGESATAGKSKAQDEPGEVGSGAWFIWALILGGAAAGIILAATSNNNNLSLGGGTTVVSPRR